MSKHQRRVDPVTLLQQHQAQEHQQIVAVAVREHRLHLIDGAIGAGDGGFQALGRAGAARGELDREDVGRIISGVQGPPGRVRLGVVRPGGDVGDVEAWTLAAEAFAEQRLQAVDVDDLPGFVAAGLEAGADPAQLQDGEIQQHELDAVAGQDAHPVARPHAQRLQAHGHARRLAVQFGQGPTPQRAVLLETDHMPLIVAAAQRYRVDQVRVFTRRTQQGIAHGRASAEPSCRRSGVKNACSAKASSVPAGVSSTASGQRSTRSMPKASPRR